MLKIQYIIFALASSSAFAQTPSLRAEADVAGDFVRIGDIIENAGELSGRQIFRSPPPGGQGSIRAERILVIAQELGMKDLDPRGRSQVTVRRPIREATQEEVASSLKTALVEVEPSLADAALKLDPLMKPLSLEQVGDARFQVELTKFDKDLERFEAKITSAASVEPVRVSGQIEVRAEVVVLTRNVLKGEPVQAADVRLENRKNKAMAKGYVQSKASVEGLVARRALSAGQPIRPEDLVRPEIVEKNQMVTILYEADGIMLALRGKALAGGVEGATIPVQNLQSKRTLEAIVAGPGRVRMPNSK